MNQLTKQSTRMRVENACFILPCLLLVATVFYIPFLMSGYYSLTEWNGISKAPVWAGLKNFIAIFTTDRTFLSTLGFTAKYVLLFVIVVNVVSLFMAVLLTQRMKSANVLRAAFFLPYILSMIVVGFIWRFIFLQGFQTMGQATGWGVFDLSWLGDAKLAFVSILIVSIWQAAGFYIVLYIAGLQAVPEDVIEAATVDGASALRRFFQVTLPLLGTTITSCVFMALTNGIKIFDIIMALTSGGPGGATYSVTMDIYREAFQNNNYGLGSAKALLLFITVLVVTGTVLKLMQSMEVEY